MEHSGFSSREDFAGSALIHCARGREFGGASALRMVALARAFRDREGIAVSLAIAASDDAMAVVRHAGFQTYETAQTGAFSALVGAERPDIVILDRGCGLSGGEAQALRRDIILMAAIDDESDLRLACDFAYYPPLPHARALGWAGARTVPRIGGEYALLGLGPRLARARNARPTLLVVMGASDPMQWTMRAARLLVTLASVFRIRFVIGRSMENAGKVAAGIVAMKSSYETVEGADDLSTEYASADLALCGFHAAHELAAFGVPAIYLGLDHKNAGAASAFAATGMGISLGVADGLTDDAILGTVKTLMDDPGRRREMRNSAMAATGGRGAARIAADLAQALREERLPLKAAR